MAFIKGKAIRLDLDGNILHQVPELLGDIPKRYLNVFFKFFCFQWSPFQRAILALLFFDGQHTLYKKKQDIRDGELGTAAFDAEPSIFRDISVNYLLKLPDQFAPVAAGPGMGKMDAKIGLLALHREPGGIVDNPHRPEIGN